MNQQQVKLHQTLSRKAKKCFTFSIIIISLLSITKMVLSNRASSWGNQLKLIKMESMKIEKHNLFLKGQLAQKTGGLHTLAKSAPKDGYTDKPNYKYFSSGTSVAQVLP